MTKPHQNLFVATFLAVSALSVTNAAAETFDWTGLYVGIHAGYGWNADDAQYDGLENGVINPSGGWAGFYPDFLGEKALDAGGLIGGIQTGYNYQVDSGFVLGFEADISHSNMKKSSSIPTPVGFSPASVFYQNYELDWFGTARLRSGYAFDRSLIYATGGLAGGQVSTDFLMDEPSPTDLQGSNSDKKFGWVIGGGIEHALSEAMTIKGEYLYYDLADTRIDSLEITPGFTTRYSTKNNGHIIRLGLNYHF